MFWFKKKKQQEITQSKEYFYDLVITIFFTNTKEKVFYINNLADKKSAQALQIQLSNNLYSAMKLEKSIKVTFNSGINCKNIDCFNIDLKEDYRIMVNYV